MAWYDSALYAIDSLFGGGGPPMDEEEGYEINSFTGGPAAEREEAAREPFDMGANQEFQNVLDKADADERQRKIQEDIQRQNQQFQQQNFPPVQAQVQQGAPRPGQVTGRGPRFGKGSAHQAGLEARTARQQGGLEARKQRHKQALAGRGMRAV